MAPASESPPTESYCFRIRFHLPPSMRLGLETKRWVLQGKGDGESVVLEARDAEAIKDASVLIVLGKPYADEAVAKERGLQWQAILKNSFARCLVGADFGDRSTSGVLTKAGVRHFEAQLDQRVLTDIHGLMTFECEPRPRLMGFAVSGAVVTRSSDNVLGAIQQAVKAAPSFNPVTSEAYDLFGASHFTGSLFDARFLMLMMAIEMLLNQVPRSQESNAHLERLMQLTKESALPAEEINSLVGSLSRLRNESVQSAGRRLVARLGTRTYMDQAPVQFFTDCYALRSKLVHGEVPRPSRSEVSSRGVALEKFVADLLTLVDDLGSDSVSDSDSGDDAIAEPLD